MNHVKVLEVNEEVHSFQLSKQTSTAVSDAPKETRIMAETLGDSGFKEDYNLKYAYLAGECTGDRFGRIGD